MGILLNIIFAEINFAEINIDLKAIIKPESGDKLFSELIIFAEYKSRIDDV